MDDALHFALASQLLATYGGYSEPAWELAGRMIESGASPRDLFLEACVRDEETDGLLSSQGQR